MRPASFFSLLLFGGALCSAQTAPPVQSAAAPHYPPIAVAARVTGTVSVRVKIDREGRVSHAEVIDGPRLLQLGAEATAKLWRFDPAEKEQTATLRFTYILLPETADTVEQDVKFKPPYEVVVERHPVKPLVSYGASSKGESLSHEASHAQGTASPTKP